MKIIVVKEKGLEVNVFSYFLIPFVLIISQLILSGDFGEIQELSRAR